MNLKMPKSFPILIATFFVGFGNFPYITIYGTVRYALLASLSLFIATKYKAVLKREYQSVNIILILLALSMTISSYTKLGSINSTRNYLLSSILFFISVIEVFLVIEYYATQGKMHEVYSAFFLSILFLNIVTDYYIITQPNLYLSYGKVYLIGTKFAVAYSHIFMVFLYALKRIPESHSFLTRVKALVLILWSFFIIQNVDCNTGLIGLIIAVTLMIFTSKKTRLLYDPILYLGIIFLSTAFVITYTFVLNLSFIKNFVENILGRSSELTGRTWIYGILGKVLMKNPFFGNGFGSSYDIMMNFQHGLLAPNTQNGLTEWLLEGGIVSTVIFLLLIGIIFSRAKKKSISYELNLSCCILYTLAILASVEVTLNKSFYLSWLAIFWGSVIEKELPDRY